MILFLSFSMWVVLKTLLILWALLCNMLLKISWIWFEKLVWKDSMEKEADFHTFNPKILENFYVLSLSLNYKTNIRYPSLDNFLKLYFFSYLKDIKYKYFIFFRNSSKGKEIFMKSISRYKIWWNLWHVQFHKGIWKEEEILSFYSFNNFIKHKNIFFILFIILWQGMDLIIFCSHKICEVKKIVLLNKLE